MELFFDKCRQLTLTDVWGGCHPWGWWGCQIGGVRMLMKTSRSEMLSTVNAKH